MHTQIESEALIECDTRAKLWELLENGTVDGVFVDARNADSYLQVHDIVIAYVVMAYTVITYVAMAYMLWPAASTSPPPACLPTCLHACMNVRTHPTTRTLQWHQHVNSGHVFTIDQSRCFEKRHFKSIGSEGGGYCCRPEFGDVVEALNDGLRKFKGTDAYWVLCDRYPSIACDVEGTQWSNKNTIGNIADHPTTRADIVIAKEADWGEYNYIEDGMLKGFDIELTREVCKAAGKTCAIVTVPWQSVWPMQVLPGVGVEQHPEDIRRHRHAENLVPLHVGHTEHALKASVDGIHGLVHGRE